ncbi:MAG: carbohydrate kinase, partial [bacterium]|nr:carbohydrate kinase [bacterium]
RRFGWEAVCVTRGSAGCSILIGDEFAESPGRRVMVADTVGAGDAFAAAFLHGLGAGWPAAEIGEFANRVGALIASREGATPAWDLAEALATEPPGPAS